MARLFDFVEWDIGSRSRLRSSRWERRWPASFGELSPQRQAGAGRTRDKPLLFVDDITFDEAYEPASADHPCFGAKRRFPHRPQEIDLQLQSREALICRERGVVREAHGCVSDVAQHASMESSHRVGVALISDEFDHSHSVFRLKELETEKLADGRRKFFWLQTWALLSSVHTEPGLRLHDVRVDSQIATALAFRELILVALLNDVVHFLPLILVYTKLGPKIITKGHTSAQQHCPIPKLAAGFALVAPSPETDALGVDLRMVYLRNENPTVEATS
jgi:hypothetical protein